MHVRFIARSFNGFGGHWGLGDTIAQAIQKMKKAGAKKKDDFTVWQFTSELPFAPTDRDAEETEADVWIDRNGSINWIRCKREKYR